ncbi:MAG: rhodanese-like domain-containing protein [Desulfobacterales bacterium]
MKWKGFQEATAILLLAACLAFGFNALRKQPLPLLPKTSAVAVAPAADPSSAEPGTVAEIPIEEAVRLFEKGAALFVDARPEADYQAGHIQDAVNVPDLDFDRYIGPFLEKTPAEAVLITYCEGESCVLSKSLADKLVLAGFEKVFHLGDGWGQWKKRGLPTASGPG